MKKQFLLGILPVFAILLMSFTFSEEKITTEVLSPCGDYCSGYADAKEEDSGPMTMEEWTAIYNSCTERRCPELT